MKTLSKETMQQIDGGGWGWLADFACGASLAVAVGGGVMISAGTGGLAAPLVFAAGYSLLPSSCLLAVIT